MNEDEGFWGHAFSSLGDNFDLVLSAAADLVANVTPGSGEFLSGDAYRTAQTVEEQRARDEGREVDPERIAASGSGGVATIGAAASQTVDDTEAVAGQVLSGAGKALDVLTDPWLLGGIAVVIVGVLAAPYLVPAVRAVTK